jgi:hypothetical protein
MPAPVSGVPGRLRLLAKRASVLADVFMLPNGCGCLPQRPLNLVAVGALVRACGTDWALGAEPGRGRWSATAIKTLLATALRLSTLADAHRRAATIA